MNTVTWQDCFKAMQNQARKSFSIPHLAKAVTTDLQQREIISLRNMLDYEIFFFITDNVTFRIDAAFGTYKWLGWKENEFTLEKFFSLIHPTFLASHITSCFELVKNNFHGKWPVTFLSPKLITTIALKHRSGEYHLFKMQCCPFQHDNEFRVLSYLTEWTLLGPYQKDSLKTRLTDNNGNNIEWNDSLLRSIKKSFESRSVFSAQEFRILNKYAYQPSLTSNAAAMLFNVKESTIITHKRRILNKAETFFQRRFHTIKEVAAYLREHYLI